MNRRVEDPYLNVRFRLLIQTPEDSGAAAWADFSECSGLSLETATEEYAEGGENRFAYKFPTRGQVPNLVFKKGITASRELWDWFVQYLDSREFQVSLRDGEVRLLGLGGDDDILRAWKFTRAFPVRWTGPDLNALSPGIAFESLEVAHTGLRLTH
jgi:phage tail-like protein